MRILRGWRPFVRNCAEVRYQRMCFELGHTGPDDNDDTALYVGLTFRF